MAKKQEEKKATGSFLTGYNKECKDIDGISLSSPSPNYWLDAGSLVINKIISGSYDKGWASGRLGAVAGPSASGKSFLLGNAVKSALNNTQQEWGVLVVDSENAVDDDYLSGIGANIDDNPLYNYRGVSTISQTVNVVSKFIKAYKEAGETMPFLITIDSLDNLMTDSETTQYESGEMKGDQGQHSKQVKALLKRFVADVKGTNIVMLCSKGMYANQDPIAKLNDPFVLNEAVKFAFSQILTLTKFKLKDKATSTFEGINLKVRGEKTRFAKPFQQATIELPYDVGMDPYTGMLDVAVSLGIVQQGGSWYTYNDTKFQKSNFDSVKAEVIAQVLIKDAALDVQVNEEEMVEDRTAPPSRKQTLMEKTSSEK